MALTYTMTSNIVDYLSMTELQERQPTNALNTSDFSGKPPKDSRQMSICYHQDASATVNRKIDLSKRFLLNLVLTQSLYQTHQA